RARPARSAPAMGPRVWWGSGPVLRRCRPPSTADAQLVDYRPIALGLLSLDVLEKPPPFPDQHQQAPARVVILRMRLEVLGEPIDALGQERDLHLRGPRVPLVSLELLDQALLADEGKRHRKDLLQS